MTDNYAPKAAKSATCAACGKAVDMTFHGECRDCLIDNYDYDDDRELEDDGLDECAMTSDGYCMLAGTEHCEWECPIAYSSFGQNPTSPQEPKP